MIATVFSLPLVPISKTTWQVPLIIRPPQSTLNIPAQIQELQGAFDVFVFPETEDDFLSLESFQPGVQ
jgi:hypothetical protein